jgi:hypothetical protein
MKRALLYFIFITLAVKVFPQEVTIVAEYPTAVEAGNQLSITWTVNSDGGEFVAPSFDGFIKLLGPQTSYSSNTQLINGKFSHQIANSFTYYLQAVNAGKFEIPPATYTLKGKTYKSEPVRIEVVAGASQPQQNNQPANNNAPQASSRPEYAGTDIFLELQMNKKEVYLGEAIPVRVKIYTKISLAGVSEIKYPSFTNFLKTDIETPQQSSNTQESINGVIYVSGVVQQFLLYPQVAGEFTLDPVQVTVLVQQKRGSSDPMFGDFFSTYENVPRAVLSKPVKVNVRPLPGVKPDIFSGVVGSLNLKASLSKDSVNVNDALNFRMTISGNGNLKLASAPRLKLSPDVEVYDPKIIDEISNSITGSSGRKTFDFLLIPRHYGDFTIPSVAYSYFNSSSGKYEKLETGEFHFHVAKGNEQVAPGLTVYGGLSKEDVRYVGKDVRFVKNSPGKLVRSSEILISKRAYYMIFVLSLVIFLSFLFVRREHIRRNADSNAVRNRKAGKVAAKRLREASECLKRNETDRFHEEILKAIWGYLSDKLNIPGSELTRINAVSALTERGINEEVINKLTEILDYCEYARYAPSSVTEKPEDIYTGASNFISAVENSIV